MSQVLCQELYMDYYIGLIIILGVGIVSILLMR